MSVKILESYANPCKWFNIFEDMENDLVWNIYSSQDWNNANQEQRDKMVMPAVKQFIETYKDDMINIDWMMFLHDLEDANYHTEYGLFMNLL